MPHSGGGGSHSGGSHGGGSHSSGSHGGGGSFGSRGGSKSPGPRISRRPGGRNYHYVYYNPTRDRYESYYYQGMTIPAVDIKQILPRLAYHTFIVLFFLIFFLNSFVNTIGVFIPQKADLSYASDTEVSVDDPHGLLSSTEDVMKEMENLQDLTGATPYLEVITDSDWKASSSSLRSKAYDDYITLFDDEMHLLFVISIPDEDAEAAAGGNSLPADTDWKWEWMVGDDLGQTFSSKSEEKMTECMQNCLEEMASGNLGQAFISALQEFEKVAMRPQGLAPVLLVCTPVLIYLLCFYSREIAQILWMKKCRDAKIAPWNTKEAVCPSCGLIYFTGTTTTCPKCGAQLPEKFE